MLYDPFINVMITLILAVCRTFLDRNAKFIPQVTQERMKEISLPAIISSPDRFGAYVAS